MITKTIPLYENRDDVTLTAYIWEDSTALLGGKKRPAIIICPGGGYFMCSDAEGEPVALSFAAMGYHAFVLRYSTYNGTSSDFMDISQQIIPRKDRQYPNQMLEIGRSFLLIREHAEEWLVDTDRIAICGFSAGGHNAAMYAVNWDKEIITEYFGKPAEYFRPAAAILGYPVTDYVYMMDKTNGGSEFDRAFFAASNTVYHGIPDPSDELLLASSPARNVSENTPPMFLWATSRDDLVPVQHTLHMAHALADHKIPFEVHIFEEGPHGLSVAAQASAQAKSQLFPDVAKWVDLAGCWLEKRMALPLKEKTPYEEMKEKGLI